MYQYDDDDDDVHNEGAAILESKSSILMGSSGMDELFTIKDRMERQFTISSCWKLRRMTSSFKFSKEENQEEEGKKK